MNCNDFKENLNNQGIEEVVCPGDPNYDESRSIRNTRFDYEPFCIVKCKTARDVGKVIKLCVSKQKPFRVRSGGHQHEGMCSGNDVVVIDLSKMKNIDINTGDGTAWIGPSVRLEKVYSQLQKSGYTIPGGGCFTVCTGGLVQGGGWGMLARAGGLACDVLQEVELVDANGNIIIVNKDNHKDLFWAIKGGGGGNFGVITNYKFKLMKEELATLVRIQCPKIGEDVQQEILADTLKYYLESLPSFNRKLTSFARVSPYDDYNQFQKPALSITFQYLGNERDAENDLKWFTEVLQDKSDIEYSQQVKIDEAFLLLNGKIPERLLIKNRPNLLSFTLQPLSQINLQASNETTTKRPTTTCEGQRLPHKVSSAFPKGNNISEMATAMVNYVFEHPGFDGVATYLSIHSLGGKIEDFGAESSSFFYRDKEFLLQFQAWWEHPDDPNGESYLEWIKNFRNKLEEGNHIEGGFINFVDRDLPLEYYYGDNFNRLKEIKSKYDPENVFSFEMSIPPNNPGSTV